MTTGSRAFGLPAKRSEAFSASRLNNATQQHELGSMDPTTSAWQHGHLGAVSLAIPGLGMGSRQPKAMVQPWLSHPGCGAALPQPSGRGTRGRAFQHRGTSGAQHPVTGRPRVPPARRRYSRARYSAGFSSPSMSASSMSRYFSSMSSSA